MFEASAHADHLADISFTPYQHRAAEMWPGHFRWLSTARRNALDLFPRASYDALRLDHTVFGRRIVLLSDPQAVSEVCGRLGKSFKLSQLHQRMLTPALGRGLIVSEGEAWAKQRALARKLVKRALTGGASEDAESRVARLLNEWRAGPRKRSLQSVLDDLVLLAIDLIVIDLFQQRAVASYEILDMISAHRSVAERVDLFDVMGAPSWMKSPKMAKSRAAASKMDNQIKSALVAARKKLPPNDPRAELLDRDFVVSLLAGFESVATTAVWAVCLLAAQPRLGRQLRRDDCAPDAPSSLLSRMILETLRLFPPLPFVFRACLSDVDTHAGEIRLGDLVCMSSWVIHRHHKLWDAPDRFNPDRFLGDWPQNAFVPYGSGARKCVGHSLGYRMVKDIVRSLNEAFDFAIDAFPNPRAGISLRPAARGEIRLYPR